MKIRTQKTGGIWHGYLEGYPEVDERALTEEIAVRKVQRIIAQGRVGGSKMSGMKEIVELDEWDQRVFVLDEITSNGSRSSGRLICGFCDESVQIRAWYPASADQGLEQKVKTEHFERCPSRGKVNSFDLTVFEGTGEPRRIRITI